MNTSDVNLCSARSHVCTLDNQSSLAVRVVAVNTILILETTLTRSHVQVNAGEIHRLSLDFRSITWVH